MVPHRMELMMLVFSTICCELRHVYRTWGREETVNWITQWVIELRSCWTWKANCQCVWADEYHRSSVQLSTWVFPRLIRATFTPNCDNHEKFGLLWERPVFNYSFRKSVSTKNSKKRDFAECSRSSLPCSEIKHWPRDVKRENSVLGSVLTIN